MQAAHCLRRNPMANIVNILILFSFLTLFFTFPASTQEPREINTWPVARLSGRAVPGVLFLWPWQCRANHMRRMKESFTPQCQPLPNWCPNPIYGLSPLPCLWEFFSSICCCLTLMAGFHRNNFLNWLHNCLSFRWHRRFCIWDNNFKTG